MTEVLGSVSKERTIRGQTGLGGNRGQTGLTPILIRSRFLRSARGKQGQSRLSPFFTDESQSHTGVSSRGTHPFDCAQGRLFREKTLRVGHPRSVAHPQCVEALLLT